MKQNDTEAVWQMAKDICPFIEGECLLVPIPNRMGVPINTKMLAEFIGNLAGLNAGILDILTGRPHQALYDCKKEGKRVDQTDLGFRLSDTVPEGKKIYLIDNVIATGLTAFSALKLIPTANILVHSVDQKVFDQSLYRKAFGKIICQNSDEELLSRSGHKHKIHLR